MKLVLRRVGWWFVGAGCLVAQQPAAKAVQPKSLVLRIEVAAAGSAVPRIAGKDVPPALAKVRTWEGRKLTWRLGDDAVTSEHIELALLGAGQDPKHRLDDKAGEAEASRRLVPLRIEPADGVRWGEVLRAYDMAMTAGFQELQFPDLVTVSFIAQSVSEPVVDDGVLVVPKAVFSMPDDLPEEGRPTFDVHQDGRIVHNGGVVFSPAPGRPDDVAALRERLIELRKSLVAAGRLRQRFDGEKRLGVPFLVRADLWAEWRDVRRLLLLATAPEIGFWQLQPAVGDFDYEPKLRSGWRPPKTGR